MKYVEWVDYNGSYFEACQHPTYLLQSSFRGSADVQTTGLLHTPAKKYRLLRARIIPNSYIVKIASDCQIIPDRTEINRENPPRTVQDTMQGSIMRTPDPHGRV